MNNLSVREMTVDDINFIIDYFYNASEEFIQGMGAIKSKLPERNTWYNLILSEVEKDYHLKNNYYTIWEIDNKPVGHCNVNQIVYKNKGFMHLHLWKNPNRQKGLGQNFVRKSLPFFFKNLQLENLFCEPYAHNPAPNKTLLKVGFKFVKMYEATPGKINFHQEVNQYVLSKKKFDTLI